MKTFLNKNLWWIVSLVLTFAFLPRGVVTESELNRKKDTGKDNAKWSEYLVFKLAAARMAEGTQVNAIDLKGSLKVENLGEAQFKVEQEHWRKEYERLLDIKIADSNVYRLHEHAYSYPPLWGLLTQPLHAIGNYNIEAVIWHLLVMLGLIVGARLAFLLAFEAKIDPPRAVFKGWLASSQGIGVSATVIALGYLMGPVSNQQNDSMIFAMVMGGAYLLRRDRSIAAGILFGLGAFSKGPLLLLLPWLGFKRRWVCLLTTVISGVALSLWPDAIFPANDGVSYLVRWYKIALKPLVSSGEAAAASKAWFRFNELNQSLGATYDRILGDRGGRTDVLPALFEIGDGARKVLTYGSYLILLAVALFIARRGRVTPRSIFRRSPMPYVVDQPSPARGLLLEVSVVMILALLLSPMTSPPHLCMLIAPLFLLLDRAWKRQDRLSIGTLAFCALPMLFVHKDLMGKTIVTTLRFYGISVWVMLAMLLALALMAHEARRDAATDS